MSNQDSIYQVALVNAMGPLEEANRVNYQTACDRMQFELRPSTRYCPTLSIDGNMWCALYGENPMEGVCGFGESPDEAYADFDKQWVAKLPSKKVEGEK